MSADDYRLPTAKEAQILGRLLEGSFAGHDEIADQLTSVRVMQLDSDGNLKLKVPSGRPAAVVDRIPVEAEVKDADGVMIHILLHVVDGYVDELEIFREDSRTLLSPIDPTMVRVIVY